MTILRNPIRLIAILLFVTAFSLQAPAEFSTSTTFTFRGTCGDCSGTATATLVLGNYTQGTSFDQGKVISFSYSSNLLNFTLSNGGGFTASGTIPASLPAAASVNIFGPKGANFISQLNGSWCAGINCGDDFGSGGVWSTPSSPSPAPTGVPALTDVTLGCLAAAIAVLGGLFVRKQRASA